MENLEPQSNTQEKSPKILGKISIMRHGATKYTNQFPDLTEKGINQAKERGRELKEKIDPENEDILYATSPSARAQGTMSFVLEEVGEEDVEQRVLNSIRSVKIRDHDKALEMVKEVMGDSDDVSIFDRHYANSEKLESSPDVWEPRSEVEKRFYRGLEYAIRTFIKYNKLSSDDKTPRLIAVSHFEYLNHFVAKVFGLDLQNSDLLGFTKMIELEIQEPNTETPDEIPIKVSFRNQSKDIIFDRKDRLIKI